MRCAKSKGTVNQSSTVGTLSLLKKVTRAFLWLEIAERLDYSHRVLHSVVLLSYTVLLVLNTFIFVGYAISFIVSRLSS
jgi:hypothetical protein